MKKCAICGAYSEGGLICEGCEEEIDGVEVNPKLLATLANYTKDTRKEKILNEEEYE